MRYFPPWGAEKIYHLTKTALLLYKNITVEKDAKKFFNIKVDAKSALPVYEQIKREIKLAILSGRLEDGDQLMSIRDLALQLQVNPNTIIKVYYQLEVEGFVRSRPGAGYFVKRERRRMQKEKRGLFEEATREYIFQVLDMGYSFEDVVEEISRKADQNIPNKILKGVGDVER